MGHGEPDELEITEAMIEAGLLHLYRYSPERSLAEETVAEMFRAMSRLSPPRVKAITKTAS